MSYLIAKNIDISKCHPTKENAKKGRHYFKYYKNDQLKNYPISSILFLVKFFPFIDTYSAFKEYAGKLYHHHTYI